MGGIVSFCGDQESNPLGCDDIRGRAGMAATPPASFIMTRARNLCLELLINPALDAPGAALAGDVDRFGM